MRPLLLGHRGDPAHHPENTLRGFASALRCGADGVELDVHTTRDGVAVVIHDATLERSTDGSGPVDAHTWPELAHLDAGAGERIPRLDVALDLLRGHTVAVELKPTYDEQPGLAAQVVAMARQRDMLDQVMLLAFDRRHLAAAGGLADAPRRAALVRELPADPVAVLDACGADLLASWWEHVDPPLCDALRAAGRGVLAWTVDDEKAALRLADLGVAGLISNRPCALAAVLGGRGA